MVRTPRQALVALIVAVTIATAGCADNPNRRAEIGAGTGAVLAGLIGSQIGGHALRNGAIGAALGGLAGAGVGHYMDNQQHSLEKNLSAQRARRELQITRLNGNALKIGVASDATFAVDSATLNGQAQSTFNTIAEVLKNYHETAIHVLGFTDSTGTADYNMKLSQQRALSVGKFLTGRGVDSRRVLTWGGGETHPVASNQTKAGRAKNRRVEIVIKPIVKGQERQAFSEPPPLG